ncbi:hypothetical protein BDR03DRAFT_946654 [Suillus americanus]|nr:hypothetical protein BDR03DRAFT_946654 [Suillus americanus]
MFTKLTVSIPLVFYYVPSSPIVWSYDVDKIRRLRTLYLPPENSINNKRSCFSNSQ